MDNLIAMFDGGGDGNGDPEVLEAPSPTDSTKKTWHIFPCQKLIGKNSTCYPFLDKPDKSEDQMYSCLVVSRPFATSTSQRPGPWWSLSTIKNRKTDNPLFDPLVLVKTVQDRFESTMKLVNKMSCCAIPQQLQLQ
jgi:hypothetical protein